MKKQMQERPSTLRWLICSVLVLCAQVVGLAAEEDLSIFMSDAGGPDVLVAQFLEPTIPGLNAALVGVEPTAAGDRALLVEPAPTGQAGRVVNMRDLTNFYASIQAAIDDANDGDILVAETLSAGNTVYAEHIDFKGKGITLRSGNILDPNDTAVHPETTFISGEAGEGSVVTFANGEGRDAVIEGFTIGWGVARYGGGIRIEDASPTIRNCTITSNQASKFGGGIDCVGGSPEITNCVISQNEITGDSGQGAGLNLEDGQAVLTDCIIRNNVSMNISGGLAVYSAAPTLTNCFILNNTVTNEGAQIELDDASPTITNCTIVMEEAGLSDGGVWASGQSAPIITNCIIWGNGNDLFNCGASYSCIEDGDPGLGNTSADPLLIDGPLGIYYLSQAEAGQVATSPCINSGDPDTEASLAAHLAELTTRTDGVADANTVDMGAHYALTEAEMFPLEITIITTESDDPNEVGGYTDPNGGTYRKYEEVELTAYANEGYRFLQWIFLDNPGNPVYETTVVAPVLNTVGIYALFEKVPMYELVTSVVGAGGEVDPSLRRGEMYPAGTVVTLTAEPDPTYIVDEWVGTDDDSLWTNANTVTIDSDKEVTVSFRKPRTFLIDSQHPSIAQAIGAAADHGDKIVLRAGTYFVEEEPNTAQGIDFGGKAITFSSENPDDPTCVARTIIDCNEAGRAFVFQSDEGADSVLTGFTIRRGYAVPDPNSDAGDGASGADAFGGAIACFGGASPTLTNLVIEDCFAQGQAGAAGPAPSGASPAASGLDPVDPFADPDAPTDDGDPNAAIEGTAGENGADGVAGADGAAGAPGAPGGIGGRGYGGAFYFDPNSSPVITNCTIRNCVAWGGVGGAGGAGQDGQDGQDGQPGQDGQNGGAGLNGPGGAGGNGGAGGAGGAGGIGGDGGAGGGGGEGRGGAIYFSENCRPTIRFCTIDGCWTQQGLGSAGGAAGSGGSGGAGAVAGIGGAGGDGDPEGAEGLAGTDGAGGAGGAGGIGGPAGANGALAVGGAVFFDANCVVEMSDTAISGSRVRITGGPQYMAGGVGGDGGNGGAPDGAAGVGGVGGDGAADSDAAAGAAGGNPGTGGDGSAGGDPAPEGVLLVTNRDTYGGAIYYGENCVVQLSNCDISNSALQVEDPAADEDEIRDGETGGGGAEFYSSGCEVTLVGCTYSGNSSDGNGGAQTFRPFCTVEITNGSYSNNTANWNGGAIRLWDDCQVTIDGTAFSGNQATVLDSFGGALYSARVWDEMLLDWYNGGTLEISDSRFAGNTATYGGGLAWYGYQADVSLSNCVIQSNTADDGGGLWWSGGAPLLRDCSIRDNAAMGGQYSIWVQTDVTDPIDPNIVTTVDVEQPLDTNAGNGGGFASMEANAIIENCFIGSNTVLGVGGGGYFFGESTPTLKNCLVRANTATIGGGGVASFWDAAPTIDNCTIVENIANDSDASGRGKGGGLFCSYQSETNLINSIVWDNEGQQGDQITIGNVGDAQHEAYPATLDVSYSAIQGGRSAVVELGGTLNWLAGNISDDPLFTSSYYLSQIASGQDADSPCVDAGNMTAAAAGLDDYTTRTDGRDDANQVDIGFHYAGRGRFQLIVAAGQNGTVEPTGGFYHEFVEVPLVAIPDPGYRVKEWTGADDDPSWNQNTNTVTMDTGNKFVTVEFEPDVTRNILVPREYETIEQAIEAASPGDTNIVLSEATHYINAPEGIDLQGKAIRIMSVDPNDPNKVAQTIIDCQGGKFRPKRAFHFHSGETGSTVISGVTIRNARWIGDVGVTGSIPYPNRLADTSDDHYFTPFDQEFDPERDAPVANGGSDANGVGYGGAILCENGSSPTFEKCIIEDCMVVAAQGGDGLDGYEIRTPPDTDEPGQWGGWGGDGVGQGYGGALACLGASSPTFIECTIRNCMARGGMGGDGGNGSNPNEGSGWSSNGGDAGWSAGDGHGGAVYCENGSDALFQKCVFVNNVATTGLSGEPGAAGPGSELPEEYNGPAHGGSSGSIEPDGTIAGGAIYMIDASPRFEDCRFVENMAYESSLEYTLVSSAGSQLVDTRAFMPGGGIYSDMGNTIDLDRCTFTGNITSAVFVQGGCVVDMNDCLFSRNNANGYETFYTINDGEIVDIRRADAVDALYTGGAVYIGPDCRDVRLSDCRFYSNEATVDGGAVHLNSDADIVDCSFSGNRAGDNGGALEVFYHPYRPERDPTTSDIDDVLDWLFSLPIDELLNIIGPTGIIDIDVLVEIYEAMHQDDSQDFPDERRVLDVDLKSCSFGGNEAVIGFNGVGGAVHFVDFNSVFEECYFFGNRAKNGGGLVVTAGDLVLKGGMISSNESIGGSLVDVNPLSIIDDFYGTANFVELLQDAQPAASELEVLEIIGIQSESGSGVDLGGGMVVAASNATIEDCMFQNNSARGIGGAGGALTFYGGRLDHLVKNCLFIDNDASRDGGAVWAGVSASPVLANCTFKQNEAARLGGGIYCDWDSDVTVTDCIFQSNSNVAIAETDADGASVIHSLFYDNSEGDYGLYDTVTQTLDKATGSALDVTNIQADPLFAEGPLGSVYLSQAAAGQASDSPAVDAGSALAEDLSLAALTTRTDGEGDAGVVDLGFHFSDHTGLRKFALTAEVIGGHGTVTPVSGEYYAGASVVLTAQPEAGWRISQWTGTSNDTSREVENLVVLGPDRHVTVEFEQPRTIAVGSTGQYTSIQRAIDAAEDGDVILLSSGPYDSVHPWTDISITGKNLTLMGANPDDPNAVGHTVLRGYRFFFYDVGPETIIEGVTMRDTPWFGADGENPTGTDGGNGTSLSGGAMYIFNASPTIRNCRFEGVSVTGGDGAAGGGGTDPHPMGYDGGWAGYAYGGAIYMGYLSSPLIQNCAFVDCYVEGGNGGNGGGGINNAIGGRGGNWEGGTTIDNIRISYGWDGWEWGPYMEFWKYSGYGGAVFCEYFSSPKFVDCRFENNRSFGGVWGIGGAGREFFIDPCAVQDIENFGGAVYIGMRSTPEFSGCVFTGNVADTNTVTIPDDVYISYGGSVAFEDDCSVTFNNCSFEDSDAAIGGGLYMARSTLMMIDCNVAGNSAYHGGGLYTEDSDGVISGANVHANLAMKTTVDPNLVPDPNVGFGRIYSWGGGLCAFSSPLTIYDSIFAGNRALASGGGLMLGGTDLDISVAPLVQNCLITGNTAGRDGGGIATWKSEPIVSNCTIADNVVTGALGSAYGGGLSVAYDSNAVVTNSIFWGNTSYQEGSQVAVSNGFEYGPRPSMLRLDFSTIQPDVDPNAVSTTPLDLLFLFDSTESMLESMNYIQEAVADFATLIDENVEDYRIAVADYKDFNDTDATGLGGATDYPFRVVTEFTDDLTRVVGGINSIGNPAGSGGNVDSESVFYGLVNAVDGNDLGGWRSGNVKRVILLIGDTPPHDPEPPTGYTTRDALIAAMQSPAKNIFTVAIGPDPFAEVYFANIAAGGGGAGFYVEEPNDVVDAVTEALTLITYAGPSVFVDAGLVAPGYDSVSGLWDAASGNISDDPLFIAGYYLSQMASGQTEQSPAVDAGSGLVDAPDIALSDRTTRTDGAADANVVDMGYHYAEGLTLFTLTVEVLPDANDGMPHGTVNPAYAVAYEGSADNIITLEALPDEGYKVKSWTGTDDDTLTNLTNTVTLTEDRHVTVVFEERKARVVTVPGEYPTIQAAVAASGDGDTIVVEQGIYNSGFLEFALIVDRDVTITSTNPDDPTVVANTIIDGLSQNPNNGGFANMGVIFDVGSGSGAVLNGFTIQNCGGLAADGEDGDRDEGHPDGYDGGPIHGAAIIMLPGTGPTIKNCILRDNRIVAGSGGGGVAADETTNAGRGGWGGWARGGAVYCAANTSPTFINCTIENNYAEGGNGGNGGAYAEDGGDANYGGNYTPDYPYEIASDGFGTQLLTRELWRVWQWDYALDLEAQLGTRAYAADTGIFPSGGSYYGDYRWYSGYGGGVFIDQYSNAKFISCTIRGNRTVGGMSGQGGVANSAGRFQEPLIPFEVPSYGGGVYCAAGTTVSFSACTFEDNIASETLAGADPNFRRDAYVGYGGGVAAEGTASVTFADCNFVENEADTGGGIYVTDSQFTIADSNMVGNGALRGGALASIDGAISVLRTEIKNNQATEDLNDPNDDGVWSNGAGILCLTTTAHIQDCDISNNTSDGSGGGIYLRGQNDAFITNCLIENNRAVRDGGGVSSNLYAEPTIRNCTFFGNTASGPTGDSTASGYGGAIFCGYFSEATIVDTILWQNRATLGTELAIGTGFELDPQCGKVNISFSDIFIGPNDVWVDEGCELNYGDGIIHLNPDFVAGPLGDRYLRNSAVVGQSRTSPCVNAGSDLASNVGMTRYTTRTDRVPDTGLVDMGFHYSYFEPCRFCDLAFDGIITFSDFAVFAQRWLDADCSEVDGWCDGADLTFDSSVDARDLAVLADCWLVQDVTAPLPDPAEWEVQPRKDGSSIRMEAVEAIDGWGWPVQYYFDCIYGNCHDSGWRNSPVYTDTGLSSDEVYGYRVKVRDTSPLLNETKWSVVRFAGTADRTPPAPEPIIESISGNIFIDANNVAIYQITMDATTAFDNESGGVQYFFQVDDVNSPGGHDSGWIDTETYTDTGLDPDTTYYYRVKARDLSNNLNETTWSEWASATTPASADTTPPLPNPMQFDPNGLPNEYVIDRNTDNMQVWVEMMAVTATDDSGGAVEYYFQCVSEPWGGLYSEGKGFSSGWISENYWRVMISTYSDALQIDFRVKARDEAHNETILSPRGVGIPRPEQDPVPNRPTDDNTN